MGLGFPNLARHDSLELTRSRGHFILGETPEEGARSGSSIVVSRGVPT
jgi:hypothetical protein